MPDWVWITGLVLLAAGFVLVARLVNRLVDDIQPDPTAQRTTTVWLSAALALRRGQGHDGLGTGGGGETLAGPRAGDRVAGRDPGQE